jgi:hypothetical protein
LSVSSNLAQCSGREQHINLSAGLLR